MPDDRANTPSGVRFGVATPILRVGELEASLRYYVARLAFTVAWSTPHILAGISRGDSWLMLAEGDQGHAGGWAWIGVDDVTALHDELHARGAHIRLPPTPFPWALEMQVLDPDGNVLRFGSEPVRDAPCGDWLDMRGEWWTSAGAGLWTRRPSAGGGREP